MQTIISVDVGVKNLSVCIAEKKDISYANVLYWSNHQLSHKKNATTLHYCLSIASLIPHWKAALERRSLGEIDTGFGPTRRSLQPVVLIEQQVVRNTRMYTIAHVIAFACKAEWPDCDLRFVSASKKFATIPGLFGNVFTSATVAASVATQSDDVVEADTKTKRKSGTVKRDTGSGLSYSQRKAFAVKWCNIIVNSIGTPTTKKAKEALWAQHTKRDDLADCFVQLFCA